MGAHAPRGGRRRAGGPRGRASARPVRGMPCPGPGRAVGAARRADPDLCGHGARPAAAGRRRRRAARERFADRAWPPGPRPDRPRHGAGPGREGLDSGADDYLVKPFDRRGAAGPAAGPAAPPGWTPLWCCPWARGPGPRGARGGAAGRDAGRAVCAARRACSRCWRAGRTGCSPGRSCATRWPPDARSSSLMDTYVYAVRRKLGRASVRTVRGWATAPVRSR